MEEVPVSGRGNALIDPVTVKDPGACKAEPGFVLHCLCFRATVTTWIRQEKIRREKKGKGNVRWLVKESSLKLNKSTLISPRRSSILNR